MTVAIHPEFKKLFDEMESLHLDLHGRLNSWQYRGAELLERLEEERQAYAPVRFGLMDRLAEIALPFAGEERAEHQDYIRKTTYHKIVQEAPFYHRIMNKPEGYAGDAEMMNLIYRDQYEGETPFGMLLHKDAVASDACQAVRNRRTFLREQILNVKNFGGGLILSVAAGPALEMRDVLKNDPGGDTYHFHAFDHDMETIRKAYQSYKDPRLKYLLGNAFHLIKGHYTVAIPRKFAVNYCNPIKDFKKVNYVLSLMKYAFENLQKYHYDLVYSAGLFDYIKTFYVDATKGTIALTKHLFELVKPGGSLVIGNFSPNNPRDLRFPMEYIYDWQLFHRTREEMLNFAHSIPKQEVDSMTVEQEPLGINYFLKIDKTG